MELARRIRTAVALTCALLCWPPASHALDPKLDATQYRHTAWRIRDGFVKERIVAMAQTTDGYLWLATRSGILRFDGVRTIPWEPPPGTSLPEGDITAILGAHDGTLWIGTLRGLASFSRNQLTIHPRIDFGITQMVEAHDGTLWIAGSLLVDQSGTSAGRLCAMHGASAECHGEDGSLGAYLNTVYEDSKGSIWLAGNDRVWRWAPGAHQVYQIPEGIAGGVNGITEMADGTILVVTRAGLRRVVGDALEPLAAAGAWPSATWVNAFRDRDGGLWFGTADSGLVHVHGDRVDVFTHADGLSGDAAWGGWFEDREGNVWALTRDGLDLFRRQAAVPYGEPQQVPSPWSVVASPDGTIWTATRNGLLQLREGRPHRIVDVGGAKGASLLVDRQGRIWVATPAGLGFVDNGSMTYVDGVPSGFVDSIAQDTQGGLWLAHRDAGLIHVVLGRGVETIPWARIDGRWAWRIAADAPGKGLWLGFYSGGIAHWVDGRVTQAVGVAQGLGKGRIRQVIALADGTVWAATDGGLSRVKGERVATLDRRTGLPCDTVLWTIEDADRARWVALTCGLVRIARPDIDAWAAAMDSGRPAPALKPTVLEAQDGVGRLVRTDTFSPHAARTGDGKLWFLAEDAMVAVDPRDLARNPLPPPVRIEEVVADRTRYDTAAGSVRLPPLVRDVVIDYTALSFVAPEKMRFRYRLEGQDADWREVLNDREVQYSNLAPGRYRFQVIASNDSGVWNEQGAALDIEVAPAFWQTNWFRALCLVAIALLLFGLYRLRERQLRQRFALTLETRVAERTRIARDLHDTLLQSFHGLLLRFQTVSALLPGRAVEAKAMLDNTIDQAADAITEGRDAVQALRTSTTEMNNLAASIRTLADELLSQRGLAASVPVGVEVHGVTRALHPIVRDEAFRIVGEALRNALNHAGASRIEVEIAYDRQQFRLRVRDDGKGIDPKVLEQQGREGHFGLPGMRERAAVVGGKLTVWSALDAGTEIELTVPAANAYVAMSAGPVPSPKTHEGAPTS